MRNAGLLLILSCLIPLGLVLAQAPVPVTPLQGTTPEPAPTHFTLELYYEHESDHAFAQAEAAKLIALVHSLAPHIDLQVLVFQATDIKRVKFPYGGVIHDVPTEAPSRDDRQSLLISSEDVGAEGWAGEHQGCLSKAKLVALVQRGGDSADVTIHEWLHTIAGLEINGRKIPNPHTNAAFGFPLPTERSPNGIYTWHAWYAFMLREH